MTSGGEGLRLVILAMPSAETEGGFCTLLIIPSLGRAPTVRQFSPRSPTASRGRGFGLDERPQRGERVALADGSTQSMERTMIEVRRPKQ